MTLAGVIALSAQEPAKTVAPAVVGDAWTKMSAGWHINVDLSTDTSKMAADAASRGTGSQDPGGGGSRGGGIGGGGFGVGYPGSHHNGGGYGGAPGVAGRGSPNESEGQRQVHALTDELTETPAQITITATDKAFSVTDGEGEVRQYVPNGKKEKVDLGIAEVEVTSKWDKDVLTQEFTGGSMKLTTTYEVTTLGNQLVVTLTSTGPDNQKGRKQPPIKRVYDRVQ